MSAWATSSGPYPASPKAWRAQAAMAGLEWRFWRSLTNQWSWASAPDSGKTQRSSGTPAARAASTEQRMTPAAWSVWMLAFISFGYGNPIMRLSALGVPISSADLASGDQACGFDAATSENRDHKAA